MLANRAVLVIALIQVLLCSSSQVLASGYPVAFLYDQVWFKLAGLILAKYALGLALRNGKRQQNSAYFLLALSILLGLEIILMVVLEYLIFSLIPAFDSRVWVLLGFIPISMLFNSFLYKKTADRFWRGALLSLPLAFMVIFFELGHFLIQKS